MAEKIKEIKLRVKGGAANPSPPVGPALGQHGLNIMDFCKKFNEKTQAPHLKDVPLPVVISVYNNKSFTFVIKTPTVSYLIIKAANIDKGSNNAKSNKVGKLNRKQLEEIAQIKMPDLTASDLDAAVRCVAGSARSMGIDVEGVV